MRFRPLWILAAIALALNSGCTDTDKVQIVNNPVPIVKASPCCKSITEHCKCAPACVCDCCDCKSEPPLAPKLPTTPTVSVRPKVNPKGDNLQIGDKIWIGIVGPPLTFLGRGGTTAQCIYEGQNDTWIYVSSVEGSREVHGIRSSAVAWFCFQPSK